MPLPVRAQLAILLPVLAAATAAGAASMSPERLRLCVGLEIEREAIDRVRQEQTRALEAAERRLDHSAQWLAERRGQLDRSDETSLARYNHAVAAHNRLHDEVQERIATLDASVPRQNELVRCFNGTCLADVVSERDWQMEKLRQRGALEATAGGGD